MLRVAGVRGLAVISTALVFGISMISPAVLLAQGEEAVPTEEELRDLLNLVADRALTVEITARITENGVATVWDFRLSELTVSGRGVAIRLEGSNVTVAAEFTPYRDDDQEIYLVAQGQTWLSTGTSTEVRYIPAIRSTPIQPDEPVIFYPLGQSADHGEAVFNIELEVRVRPYVARQP